VAFGLIRSFVDTVKEKYKPVFKELLAVLAKGSLVQKTARASVLVHAHYANEA